LTHRYEPLFAIIAATVFGLDEPVFEYLHRVFEAEPPIASTALALFLIPGKAVIFGPLHLKGVYSNGV
jgi:hypothetical protein